MGHREAVYVIQREPADPGVSPNRVLGEITAEIRVFFPYDSMELAADLLHKAYMDAVRKLYDR